MINIFSPFSAPNPVSLPFLIVLKMKPLFLISLPGGTEWLIILFVVLLLFGGKKIPELMRGLGKGIREFNNARNNIETEIREGMREADRKAIEESKKES